MRFWDGCFQKIEAINECSNERADLQLEIESLNEMMYEQGLDIGEDVKMNLQNMLTMCDKMEVDNQDMNDSITAQKERIEQLMLDLEDAKGDKQYYASKVAKLQKKLKLRSIMKDYIRTMNH